MAVDGMASVAFSCCGSCRFRVIGVWIPSPGRTCGGVGCVPVCSVEAVCGDVWVFVCLLSAAVSARVLPVVAAQRPRGVLPQRWPAACGGPGFRGRPPPGPAPLSARSCSQGPLPRGLLSPQLSLTRLPVGRLPPWDCLASLSQWTGFLGRAPVSMAALRAPRPVPRRGGLWTSPALGW